MQVERQALLRRRRLQDAQSVDPSQAQLDGCHARHLCVCVCVCGISVYACVEGEEADLSVHVMRYTCL